ncbi:hypothetical protein E3O55_13005 [Cryobacterium sp. MDB1-18-2]|uniref:hypothetical protein n=1 Tax=unclassified Cryobacterium TaxID=2649013 RepID=UPI00106A2EBB|nr:MULTISPECIES: hypothetical protein [unclassified Cryobacterium]TFC26992.1 hypothetical protein E3O55_13005 [Cryobacterium sp. MDB1-18-2]TFC44184.1 hypothetical protein E3O50_06020 [Cryobacterium sp. MDB1-18-1]
MSDDDLDIALELATAKHQAMLRSKIIMAPCIHCYAVPVIERKDAYGFPSVTGWTHGDHCPDRAPE